VGAAWVVGDRQRIRRTYLAELEDRAARLERERDDRDRLAVAAERSRIARELHDVVAHSVSVMVVQAGAARHNLRSHPRRAEEAIREVESTGRQSLVELRRLLGVLRVEDGEAALRPQPRLVDLDELVHRFAEAGLPVSLERHGDPRPLPQGVDLSLYRVVQEALTNSLKHAAASRVLVRLRYAGDEVSVSVEDDGRGSSSALAGGGNGLVGMRERAALLGGVLAFGPRPEGGFGVVMTIPLEPAAARPSGVAPTG
jgi:signal transduction histidine kinase